jgi:hypothetical protein
MAPREMKAIISTVGIAIAAYVTNGVIVTWKRLQLCATK